MWYTGKISRSTSGARSRTNVTAEFCDPKDSKTWGHWIADANTYGTDRLWVLIKPIPIDLDEDDAEMGEASGSASG